MATRLEMKLLVTELQRDKIAKFIEDQGWTDIVTEVKDYQPKDKSKRKLARSTAKRFTEYASRNCDSRDSIGQDGGDRDPNHGDNNGNEKCPFCLVAPCVAVSNESAPWIGEGQPPSAENSGVRKEIYKRFWKIMDNLGVWYTEDYLDRKKNIGGGEWIVYHRREIMPDCVLDLVRSKYPNPKDIPYIGHQWE
ncbi:unnamed protein product [Mytilus coruscus]|uniref:Uncharacterized protein n=1 Tax=Mytilus coruscus TaxID=42192 RepID=A0A6J8CWX1_MYTCO|nr:unnamed protein product [Mytilus coruscus]